VAALKGGRVAGTTAADGGPRRLALWYGIFGAPVAWSVDEIASTWLHEGSCERYLGRASTAPVLLVIVGLVCLAAAVFAAVTAWRALAALGIDNGENGTVTDQRRFMAHFGVGASALFCFGIVLRFITVFFLHPCVFP
jgi:hypothetical protein